MSKQHELITFDNLAQKLSKLVHLAQFNTREITNKISFKNDVIQGENLSSFIAAKQKFFPSFDHLYKLLLPEYRLPVVPRKRRNRKQLYFSQIINRNELMFSFVSRIQNTNLIISCSTLTFSKYFSSLSKGRNNLLLNSVLKMDIEAPPQVSCDLTVFDARHRLARTTQQDFFFILNVVNQANDWEDVLFISVEEMIEYFKLCSMKEEIRFDYGMRNKFSTDFIYSFSFLCRQSLCIEHSEAKWNSIDKQGFYALLYSEFNAHRGVTDERIQISLREAVFYRKLLKNIDLNAINQPKQPVCSLKCALEDLDYLVEEPKKERNLDEITISCSEVPVKGRKYTVNIGKYSHNSNVLQENGDITNILINKEKRDFYSIKVKNVFDKQSTFFLFKRKIDIVSL